MAPAVACFLALPIAFTSSLSSSLRMSMSNAATTTSAPLFSKPVVQYIFVRRDLADWPQGAIAAQVAHASVAAIVQGTHAQDPATLYYTESQQLLSMTKYVYGVDSLEELEKIEQMWEQKCGQKYHCWMEEPEHIPTALATWPIERTNPVSKLVKNMKVTFL